MMHVSALLLSPSYLMLEKRNVVLGLMALESLTFSLLVSYVSSCHLYGIIYVHIKLLLYIIYVRIITLHLVYVTYKGIMACLQ